MKGCKDCKNWKKSDNIINDKFVDGNRLSLPRMGWCGSIATGSHDWCNNFSETEKSAA